MILEIISFIKLQELTLLKNCHRKRIPKLCDEHQKTRSISYSRKFPTFWLQINFTMTLISLWTPEGNFRNVPENKKLKSQHNWGGEETVQHHRRFWFTHFMFHQLDRNKSITIGGNDSNRTRKDKCDLNGHKIKVQPCKANNNLRQ